MSVDKMKEFLLMYQSLPMLYDYDVISNLDLLYDLKSTLLDIVMDEIERTLKEVDGLV